MSEQGPESSPLEGIAVVGMSGRFPGAGNLAELWQNVCGAVESITFHSREELAAAGVDPALLDDPRYVRASASLRDVEHFDAAFFGFSPREAELMDPQHRIFLECCWEALEDAGYDTETYTGAVGIFAGMGMSSYLLQNLLSHRDLLQRAGALQIRILNDVNYLTAMAAFKLDLRGPSVTVQSACSTSLVAVCMACQSLLQYQCDVVLAGGVTVVLPHGLGYLAQDGVMSPDGHCRAFDAGAQGTVEGSGAGVVVLKRLAAAVAEGDTIHAVIRGFATNNDGGFKLSFTAPSLDGQLEVVATALAVAGVPAESITYVEAHGTGTPLGDPVEVAALSEVFAASTERRGFCALGSIKTNIGHLDAAAGVAGLIKAVLAVEHGILPPSLHFETPNPRIDFARSPFYVNTESRPWRPEGWPRRAGVSAFAIGGVNAHVILEEPPAPQPAAAAPAWLLLVLSARTETALEAATDRLLVHLREHPDADLADIAYTLQVGRRAFRHRRVLACRDLADAAGALERRDPRRLLTGTAADDPQVAFLFPGLGNEYAGMARGLYRDDAGFRARIDDCAARLVPILGLDLREVIFPEGEDAGGEAGLDLRGLLGRSSRPRGEAADLRLRRTALSQPAVFVVEYALACRLIDWGIRPQAMVGFSIGEYVAACLAGVLSLEDALHLVARRAQLIDELPAGAMLAVPLSEPAVAPWLASGLSLAAVAGPELTVLAGTEEAVAEAEERLTAAGHVCRRLQTGHAFHSALMEPVVDRFLALFAGIELHPPEIPFLSNVTGTWITGEQATDPAYWADHLRGTVRFADAVHELWSEPGRVLVEVGPGQTLSSWALQHPAAAGVAAPLALPTVRHAFDRTDDLAFLLQSVGRLWLAGLRLDGPALWDGGPRRRVPLPTYPFERRRYWIEPRPETAAAGAPPAIVAQPVAGGPPVPIPSSVSIGAAAPLRQHPRPSLHVAYAPPRDATERRLVEILGELLHLETVGIHDSFFDLGGDSLLATHLVAHLNRELGAELTLRTIFESPTAAELAAIGDSKMVRPAVSAGAWGPVPRRAAGSPSPLPLSFAQRRLWFLDQLEPGDPAYNVPAAVLLTGPLDRAILAAALETVVARHEALRTTFVPGGDGEEPAQRIAPPAPFPFPGVDLAGLPEPVREAEALRLAIDEALRPFDLARGPLLRAVLLRLGADRHVSLFTHHHMVGDGLSSTLLVREVAALYAAFAAGRPSPLDPLPVQYADYVLWQRENLGGGELERQLAYWRGALAGAPPVLDLPIDRPRPARMSGRGGLAVAELAAEPVEALRALGRSVGATPFMVFLAAFYSLLYRLTGEADLVAGTPIANRRRPELEGLIGFFANTLVLRAGVPAGEPTFAGLLAAVREAALGAYAHQDLPFERLVEELAPRRSLSRSPLFEVLFLWHGIPPGSLELPGLTLAPFGDGATRRTAKFDLTLELAEDGPGLLALLEFRRDLFDAATADRLLGHFAVLSAALAGAPDGRIAELPLLTEGERRQLTEWNARGGEVETGGEGECLHEAFEAQAAQHPGAPALVCGGETLTYGDLDARAGHLARHLRHLGVGPEIPVAVCAGRSADLVVALLAVLKAGGAYLPLDPGYPAERLRFLLEDTAAPVLVAPSRLTGHLPAGATWVPLEAPERWTGGRDDLPSRPLPANAAYLIYTSGSTGRPKGVVIPHGAAVALVRWAAAAFSPEELGGMLASTSICFDLSVFELFVPLSLGGRVILAENALELPRLAAAGEVRMINTVPSAMGELVRLGAIPPSVRTVGLAGEPLRRDLVEQIAAAAPGVERVLNLYGPSETTTYSTWEAVDLGAAGEPAIGRPIAGTRAHVLDGALQPVPAGVPGELFLGGAGLARGYLGRPALTAERWLPDPFAAAAGSRLYRTGDRVRRRPDGRLDLLGRADAQVKIRGFRIEPGEVEAVLASLPAVAQAAVVARSDGDDGDEGGGRRLVAWVVARPGESLAAPALRAALSERLPEFMIPALFAVVEELPLNANGKVDRGVLITRPLTGPLAETAGAPAGESPLSPLEEGVAAILAEVLGRERVGRGESFFDLGGHSLLATRVVSRLRAAFGVELSVRQLFEAPTATGLAVAVTGATRAGAPSAPPLIPVPRDGNLPLSFAQQRLWFLDQLEPGRAAYNIPAALLFRGTLDAGALAAGLCEVVARHEALRTTFAVDGETGEPVQHIAPPPAFGLPLIDLSGLPPAPRSGEAERLVREEAARPFDLVRGPLVRGALARLAPREHLALFTLHHIVSDAWSAGVLIRELAVLYPELAAGRPSPLPALPVQYADFAVWQRAWLQGEVLAGLLRYWRDRLDAAPPVLELPADRPRPAVPSGRGGIRTVALSGSLATSLAALSRRAGATRFMVLLAAWNALLHRLTGQTDLPVGTPVANRGRIEIEGLIGFFTNTLVLRTDLRSDGPAGLSFRELVARVREVALSAYVHQDLPFEKLVEELSPERSLAHAPLFQTLFVLQDVSAPSIELPGLTLSAMTPPGGTAKFDLTLFVAEAGDGLLATLEHSTDLFSAAAAERLLGHFATLLAGALEEPEARLGELPLLSAAERHQIRVEWNATGISREREICVHELFEGWADRTPERVALLAVDADGSVRESLTFEEVERRANRLARRLRAAGAGPEIPVGVCLERGPDAAVALLAVLKAGACYLPLDPAYPADRLAFMLADAGAPVVVARQDAVLSEHGARVVAPQTEEDEDLGPADRLPAHSLADHLAYLIYTSGSTGRPKGVALPHRVLANLIAWQVAAAENPAGRTLQFASPSFDVSLQEVFATWGAGGTLVVVPEESRRDAAGLLRILRAAAVERLFLPFVALQQLAEAAGAAGAPEPLREVVTAGEALQITSEIAALFAALPGCVLCNQYGPSETHVVTELRLPAGGPAGWPARPPIGRPIANTVVHVLDRGLRQVAVGVPGEICLGGAGLARGYLGRPDLTAERFVPDPWERGERLYRTGDLARLAPDGEVEFLGRLDRQVKIRGFRIETGEIEAALALHPAVREAAVVARGEGAARHLVAWVVPAGEELPVPELREALAARLPAYMVPTVIAPLAELPLTPSGKVDRLALCRWETEPGASRAEAVAPRTPVEAVLAGIWAEVLGIPRAGVDDDFFSLGGHSLLATRAISRVCNAFGLEIGVRSLFESPTPARLAAVVEVALRERGGTAATAPVLRLPRHADHPIPLSFAQQRLWFLDQLAPGSPLYNIPFKVELRGRLHPGALAAALGEVVRRHETLRTRFAPGPGNPAGPVQVIDPVPPSVLARADLGALPPPARRREEARLTAEEVLRPFDLARGPVLRTLLLHRGEDDWVLVLSVHHIVSDGWSVGVLIQEVGALYAAFLAGRPSPLPELAVQYADFSVWQQLHLSGAWLERELAWWRGRLAGMPPALDLPADHPRRAAASGLGAVHRFAVDGETFAGLTRLSRRQGATLFMTLLAAFAALLGRLTGEEDLAVGTPIAGRTRVETEPLIGLFVNTLVLRTDLAGDPVFTDLLDRVREVTLSAYAHQEVPFERLVEDLAPRRDLSRPPLVQVMLVLQNAPLGSLELPGLALTAEPVVTETAKLDLTCSLGEADEGLAGTIEYNRDLFDGPTIERLAECFVRLLAGAAADPERRLSELELLSAGDRHQILDEWNDTATVYPGGFCLHELIEAQMARTPGRIAVEIEGASLTYRDLSRRSSQLAHHLRRLGVAEEVRVGICAERSLALIVGLLGILKAGGSYVPLDPEYPRERLAYMVGDSGARLVLTQESLADVLSASGVPQVLLDTGWEEIGGEREEVPETRVAPDNLAYVIYTSGSTGRPKGAMNTHRAIVNRLLWMQSAYGLDGTDAVLQKTPASFDVSVWEFFWPLLAGARLVLARPGGHRDGEYLAERISTAGVTTVHFVPSMLRAFLETEGLERCRSLRLVVASGEALTGDLEERFFTRLAAPHLELHNLYGPTEAAVDVTFWRCLGESGERGVPIGRPIANTEIRLLDRQEPVPVPMPMGVTGELYIGGVNLARGYAGRPSLTAERFVPSPWGRGERLYRTGDLARHRPDGAIEYLGRVDHQVKVRGFRIELGEIEAVLAGHPAVREAAVLLHADLPGGGALVGYVVADGAGDAEAGRLRGWLEERLPGYMVPAFFRFLEALPLTPNGKVDRKALAQLRPERAEGSGRVAPRRPAEELLAGIFAEVLGLERVGADDNFFELGGHSLLATQAVSRIRAVFGVELPVRAVFEKPLVSTLAAEIEAMGAAGPGPETPPLVRSDRVGPLPLSFGQERLWFLDQVEPGTATYNIPVQVELSGTLRAGALSAALMEVVRRHESLRTTFAGSAGIPHQRIAPPEPAGFLPLVDLSALPAPCGGAEADRLAREQAGLGFDLEKGPLFVALLVRLAEDLHRFLANLHHIVADGWSIGVLVGELGALYSAFVEGRPSPLPELPIQYADFACWQRGWLAGKQEAELAYWDVRLGGEVAPVELPADRPRPAIQTFRGGRRQLDLDAALTARLKSFGREAGVTLFMTLLAATQALLSRQSGEHEVPVGAPVAGRRWKETEGLIGFFLNTLVLRTDLSGPPSFRDLAARVRTVTLEAYSHQDVPFEAVLNRLRLDRDLSRSPLFQVLFNMLNLPVSGLSLPELELRALTPPEIPSKFDMTFYLSEAESRVWINLVYNADLFDEARMVDLLQQLEMLLVQAVEQPDEPLDRLSLVTGTARRVLPDPTEPLDGSWIGAVHELFAAQAERAPDRPAVVDGEVVWSYGELLAGSRGLAGWLAAHGVQPGDPVAILAHRSAPLVQAVQGVLSAGAAFLMLDPAYPAPRIVEMLRLAVPRAWIALEAAGSVPDPVRAWLDEAGCPCLELPAGGAAALESLAPFAARAPRVEVGPQDVACYGFTSGSTGGPKGILGLHGSLSHFLPIHCREFDLGPDDRFSLLSGLAHDPLQRDVLTPLYLGAAIVIPDPAGIGIAGRWAQWMSREGVTVAHLTPALGQLLTERPAGGEVVPVPSLRRVFLVGESLTRQDVARLLAMAPGVTCVNLYGSTETQRAVAFHRVAPEEAEATSERARQVLPLGRGIEDVQLLLLNRAGLLAGIGELGEIAVRSPHFARGYLGSEELTAERFQGNPFAPFPADPADRIYRTGDLGRYRADGEVVFAGRLDQQVKLRGFRIELGEIEGVLVGLPGVSEAVVLLRTDLPGGAGLVAYVRAEEGRTASLRGELEARLPAYMVPAAFVRLDQLPRTANGKVDRRALLRILPELGGEAVRTLPRTPAEEMLAGIWTLVLGVEQIGVEQSFFELGGHSLLATQMASRVRDVFGVELPLRSLFVTPTLAGLAAEIERLRRGAEGTELRTITSFHQERSTPPPLTLAQERYWAGRHLEARSVASTLPMLMRLVGPLDRDCLRRALAAVVDRHELLRTSFRDTPEGPIQVIHPAVPVALPEVDLEALDAGQRTEEVRRFSILDGRLHFDYERPPLFRSTLFRCAPEEHLLLFTIHHVASDAWSNTVLIRDVSIFYLAFRTGRPSDLPPLTAQFQDFARWQRRLSPEEAQASQVTFWREHLSGAVPIDLGAGRPRPLERTFAAGIEEIRVPEELERQLDRFSAQQGVTLFMTLLAAFTALLHLETGQDDVVVPCSFANRNHLETESLIGNLATGLPLRTRLSGVRTFHDLLQRVRDVTLLAHDHPDIFWEPVVEGMSFLEPGDRGGLTTFRILFQLVKVPPAAEDASGASGFRIIRLPVDTGKIRLDLSLFLSQADGLTGRFRYNRDVLDPARVAGLRDRFLRILAAAVADPDHPLAELAPTDPQAEEPGTRDLAIVKDA